MSIAGTVEARNDLRKYAFQCFLQEDLKEERRLPELRNDLQVTVLVACTRRGEVLIRRKEGEWEGILTSMLTEPAETCAVFQEASMR